jgi:very-short-patch-repair endonuclease
MNDTRGRGSNSEPLDAVIARCATSQYGVFSRAQVRALGVTERQIAHRMSTGRWFRVLPAVYAIAGGVPHDERSQAMAATLWAGADSLVAFGTAAELWGLEGVRSGRTEIWIPAASSRRSRLVVVHRGSRLDRADRTRLGGIPITTPTRTLIDVAARLENEALLAIVEAAFRAGLTTPDRLAARLAALRGSGRAGGGRLEAVLDARPVDAAALESRLEAKFWRLLARSSLPRPERQHWIVVDGRRYRLDFAWPDQRVAVECEGRAFHGPEHFERAERRRGDISSAHWRVVPVTWRQLTSAPRSVISRIERALAAERVH